MRTIEQILSIFPNTQKEDWSQHKNGGGWKQGTAQIDNSAHLGPDAILSGNAWVSGNAEVSGNARVYGNARVSGNAGVYGDAWDKTPIQILTDSYTFQAVTHTIIAAGCEHHTFEHWADHITEIANAHGVTDEAIIAEYFSYIELIHNWQVSRFGLKK